MSHEIEAGDRVVIVAGSKCVGQEGLVMDVWRDSLTKFDILDVAVDGTVYLLYRHKLRLAGGCPMIRREP